MLVLISKHTVLLGLTFRKYHAPQQTVAEDMKYQRLASKRQMNLECSSLLFHLLLASQRKGE